MNFFNEYKKYIIIGLIIFFMIIIFSIFYINKDSKNDISNIAFDNENLVSQNNLKEEITEYYVEVKGAVKKPGVYKLKDGSIINDLIKLAGGFNKNAYTNNINLSKKITNELVVYVYKTSEYKKINTNKEIIKEVYIDKPCETSTYNIDNCIKNGLSEIISSDKDTVFKEENNIEVETNTKINLNTADINELQKLNGIGESKANDIINYRNSNGLFKSIDEIKNVSGIGNALFEKIKDYITV